MNKKTAMAIIALITLMLPTATAWYNDEGNDSCLVAYADQQTYYLSPGQDQFGITYKIENNCGTDITADITTNVDEKLIIDGLDIIETQKTTDFLEWTTLQEIETTKDDDKLIELTATGKIAATTIPKGTSYLHTIMKVPRTGKKEEFTLLIQDILAPETKTILDPWWDEVTPPDYNMIFYEPFNSGDDANWTEDGAGTWITTSGYAEQSGGSGNGMWKAVEYTLTDFNYYFRFGFNNAGDYVRQWICGQATGIDPNTGYLFEYEDSTPTVKLYDDADANTIISDTTNLAPSTWYDVNINRAENGLIFLYINGALQGTPTANMNYTHCTHTSFTAEASGAWARRDEIMIYNIQDLNTIDANFTHTEPVELDTNTLSTTVDFNQHIDGTGDINTTTPREFYWLEGDVNVGTKDTNLSRAYTATGDYNVCLRAYAPLESGTIIGTSCSIITITQKQMGIDFTWATSGRVYYSNPNGDAGYAFTTTGDRNTLDLNQDEFPISGYVTVVFNNDKQEFTFPVNDFNIDTNIHVWARPEDGETDVNGTITAQYISKTGIGIANARIRMEWLDTDTNTYEYIGQMYTDDDGEIRFYTKTDQITIRLTAQHDNYGESSWIGQPDVYYQASLTIPIREGETTIDVIGDEHFTYANSVFGNYTTVQDAELTVYAVNRLLNLTTYCFRTLYDGTTQSTIGNDQNCFTGIRADFEQSILEYDLNLTIEVYTIDNPVGGVYDTSTAVKIASYWRTVIEPLFEPVTFTFPSLTTDEDREMFFFIFLILVVISAVAGTLFGKGKDTFLIGATALALIGYNQGTGPLQVFFWIAIIAIIHYVLGMVKVYYGEE